MSRIKLLGISGSLSKLSKTEIALRTALESVSDTQDVQTELALLSELTLPFCDGRNPDDYTGDALTIIDKISEADALLIGSPIYRGSYSGALKNLLDLIPNHSLEGKPAGIIATGGSDHHFLAIEHQFKPVLGFFNAYIVPGGVYLKNSHYQDGRLTDENSIKSLHKLSSETVRLARLLQQSYSGPEQPDIKRESLKDTIINT